MVTRSSIRWLPGVAGAVPVPTVTWRRPPPTATALTETVGRGPQANGVVVGMGVSVGEGVAVGVEVGASVAVAVAVAVAVGVRVAVGVSVGPSLTTNASKVPPLKL